MIYRKIMIYFLVGLYGCYYYNACHAVTIGSDTSVDIITPAPEFSGTGNQILTFAFCKDGFTLDDDVASSCDYYSVFPVGGPVVLNGGWVMLYNDLHLVDEATPLTYGGFYGGDPSKKYHVELPQKEVSLVSNNQGDQLVFENVDLIVHEGLNVVSTSLYFTDGSCVIRGDGPEASSITLDELSEIVVTGATTLTIENITLKGVGNPSSAINLRCNSVSGSLILKNVKIVQSGDYLFDTGSLTIMNDCVINTASSEGFSFTYNSVSPLSIERDSSLLVDEGMTFQYDGVAEVNDRIIFSDHTSKIILNNATFRSGYNSIRLMKGTLVVRGNSFLTSDLAQTTDFLDPVNNLSLTYFGLRGFGIIVGDPEEGDFFLSVEPAAQLIVTQNTTLKLENASENPSPSHIQLGESSVLRFQTGSFFFPVSLWVVNQGKVVFEDSATLLKPTLVSNISGNVVYEGKIIQFGMTHIF